MVENERNIFSTQAKSISKDKQTESVVQSSNKDLMGIKETEQIVKATPAKVGFTEPFNSFYVSFREQLQDIGEFAQSELEMQSWTEGTSKTLTDSHVKCRRVIVILADGILLNDSTASNVVNSAMHEFHSIIQPFPEFSSEMIRIISSTDFQSSLVLPSLRCLIVLIPRGLSSLEFISFTMLSPLVQATFPESTVESSYLSVIDQVKSSGLSKLQYFNSDEATNEHMVSTHLKDMSDAIQINPTDRPNPNEACEDVQERSSSNQKLVDYIQIQEEIPSYYQLLRSSANPLIPLEENRFAADDLFTPNDVFFPLQWSVRSENKFSIAAEPAWKLFYDNLNKSVSPAIIAIIDSGCDLSHEDLASNYWENKGEICGNGKDDDENGFIDDCYGWDFVEDLPLKNDPSGHGTASAGILGAKINNSVGISGVCPACKIMCIRAIKAEATGGWINSGRLMQA
ncbi:hypothetical protein IE077_000615 [Cardiosporidium cionae]|uniref:subtilisin n=1 Tax=Cardiosporidium cionae TaxID=476202 RepID=A0ABQ7J7J7_9APIC|nr:hypothetical protein IE077_000615 [Cardiosporidium cionae]|eukprot:KAF8819918.1 hypothetical protein IE077_000615 [Cardiosporidium cionae]